MIYFLNNRQRFVQVDHVFSTMITKKTGRTTDWKTLTRSPSSIMLSLSAEK